VTDGHSPTRVEDQPRGWLRDERLGSESAIDNAARSLG
jgi:hypothetical protein